MLLPAAKSRLASLFINASFATFFPAECVLCNRPVDRQWDHPCCHLCWELSVFEAVAKCHRCDFPYSVIPFSGLRRSCENCYELSFSYARAAGTYDGAIRASILRLKTIPSFGREFLQRLLTAFGRLPMKPDLVTAPPLHPLRFRERGFNQAELLAREVAIATGVRASFSVLTKLANTGRHRAAQDRKERTESLKEAFEVRAPRLVEGRHILIVDDLMTTGATADALSRNLLASGAASVSVLTAARASGFFVD